MDLLRLSLMVNVPSWFKPSCKEIIRDQNPPKLEELSGLPIIFVVLLFRCRELYHGHDNWSQDVYANIYPRIAPKQTVEDILDNQLTQFDIDIGDKQEV